MEDKPKVFEMCLGAGGILTFLLLYGVIQERIMTQPYGEDEEMFTYSAYLVLNNRIVACCVAIAILFVKGENMANVAPILNYFGISFSNTAATVCQYEALRYVTFPTQTLGKCGKTIPVLILGSLIAGKQYGFVDYAVCVMVTIGCTVFVLTGDIASSSHAAETDSFWGLLLMAGYLSCDGFTSVFQEKLFKQYKISSYNQMLYVNLCSGIMSLLGLISAGQLMPAIDFSLRNPGFMVNAFGLSLCATMGQLSIYYTIKNFGALFFATVMTTRQVVSIVLSCMIFFHPLTLGQGVGAAIVFGTLYWKATQKKAKKPPLPTTNKEAAEAAQK
eukprot:TRINITY_DN21607_c0_g1_i1.p1 TRINITY_DN21607_c0_g1~~TRINITY_DN21607_c0_g1_i1.p1  ORF type:complete len:342 (-),score=150.11 TRINITY_DN21607_c0_g1_i1:118-1110(-)